MNDTCDQCGKEFDPDMRIDREEYCQCPDPDYMFDDLEEPQREAVEKLEKRIAELEAENAKLRNTLIAAEESLATYVGSFGYQDGGKLVLKQVRQALTGRSE